MNNRLVFVLVGLSALVAFGATEAYAKTKKKSDPQDQKFASIVIDYQTGDILSATNPDRQLHPASLTKIMTLLLTFEAIDRWQLKRSDYIRVSNHAASMSPSKLGIRPGGKIRLEDAIRAVAVKSANDMAHNLGDLVWAINPNQDSLQKLVQRLEEYAQDMAAAKNVQLYLNIPAHLNAYTLPVESRRNVYLFCKEAINNAIKYSNCTLLQLNVIENNGTLNFTVSDNGKGFNSATVKHGNGLENMQKRAEEIGAAFLLQSEKKTGSVLSLQIKIT